MTFKYSGVSIEKMLRHLAEVDPHFTLKSKGEWACFDCQFSDLEGNVKKVTGTLSFCMVKSFSHRLSSYREKERAEKPKIDELKNLLKKPS